jgi:DNA-binding LytR/AlgR family response regulator
MCPKILVVEDEVIIADYIENILLENNFKSVVVAHDKETAELLIIQENPDVIILDINLSGKNEGIDIAQNYSGKASIIFLTGQKDHKLMSQAIATQPKSYLTKPIKKTDLLAALHLTISSKEQDVFTLKDGFDKINLKYSEIHFFKSAKNYVEIHLENRKYVDRTTLKDIENVIPSGFNFKRVHRSFLVNMSKARTIGRNDISLGDVKIPIGRRYFST